MGRLLIVNPVASGVTPSRVAAVRVALEQGGPVEMILTERAGHAVELAREAAGSDAVYVFSGDGGFNEVVNGLEHDVPVGFLPGGATSVLPRALGLPADPVACAHRLALADRTRLISLGRIAYAGAPAGRRFTFSAGVGLDAELVRAVDARGRRDGKRPGDLAFVAELGGLLWRRRGRMAPLIEIEERGRCAFAVIANCDPYTFAGPFSVHAAPRASFEGGLDLVGVRELRPADLPRLAWWLLAHPVQERSANVVTLHDADRIELRCDAPMPLQIDGEDLGDVEEIVAEAERDVLRVLV
jgi:diacylglycerol kinase family enzyme